MEANDSVIKTQLTFKEFVHSKGLNSNKLSVNSQLPSTTVKNLMSGKASIIDSRLRTVIAIAKTLNVTVEELYSALYQNSIK